MKRKISQNSNGNDFIAFTGHMTSNKESHAMAQYVWGTETFFEYYKRLKKKKQNLTVILDLKTADINASVLSHYKQF